MALTQNNIHKISIPSNFNCFQQEIGISKYDTQQLALEIIQNAKEKAQKSTLEFYSKDIKLSNTIPVDKKFQCQLFNLSNNQNIMNKVLNKSTNEENDSPEMNSNLSLHNPMSMRSNSIKMKNSITNKPHMNL